MKSENSQHDKVEHVNFQDGTNEEIPENFTVVFKEYVVKGRNVVQILVNNSQAGDIINDNSKDEDFYRYHDVFHYTFASCLGWSPCTRTLLGKKRKSSPLIDEYEDGARATITEEAISLMIFSEAKKSNFFTNNTISSEILELIKQMTLPFEVSKKSKEDWENAIFEGYRLFRLLKKNKGGIIEFSKTKKSAIYSSLGST